MRRTLIVTLLIGAAVIAVLVVLLVNESPAAPILGGALGLIGMSLGIITLVKASRRPK